MSEQVNSTGVVLEWEKQAIRGDEMPDGLDYPEQVLYLQLRMLYAQTRSKVIDRDTAVQEKKKLLDEYRVYKYHWRMGEQWAQVIKDTELARSEFRKNPSIEAAEKLVAVIEGRKLTKIEP